MKLAYPTFAEAVRNSIAKDYFVRNLYYDMQVAIKSTDQFSAYSIDQTADAVSRLELAGVKSSKATRTVNLCEEKEFAENVVDKIAEKVFEKIKDLNVSCDEEPKVNAVDNCYQNRRGGRYRQNFNRQDSNRGSNRGNYRKRNSGNSSSSVERKCRSCFSTEHFLRNCPTRFCRACGQRGHDQSNAEECPNYHP